MKLLLKISAIFLTVMAGANALARPVSFPGTGVRIDAPAYLSSLKAGAVLIDEPGETIIAFSGGPAKTSLETDPNWRALYKNPPEKIKTKYITANLYRRTRAADGGGWDGWFLAITRGDKSLAAMASYTGNSQASFEQIKEYLLTVRWDESDIKPEEAMGVRLSPGGLQVVPGMFGALAYNKGGRIGAFSPNIFILNQPITLAKAKLMFPAGCDSIMNGAFAGKSHEGPELHERGAIQFCDAWGSQAPSEMSYFSLVKLPNGALLTIMGKSPKPEFNEFLVRVRNAVGNMSVLRQ
ncbi:hypothetical protein [Undibacterium sp.]|uniref:hypothetical protein n=1 Tax=Undibacterium sp. TaxID=1914977 RepID=UPI00374DDD52